MPVFTASAPISVTGEMAFVMNTQFKNQAKYTTLFQGVAIRKDQSSNKEATKTHKIAKLRCTGGDMVAHAQGEDFSKQIIQK